MKLVIGPPSSLARLTDIAMNLRDNRPIIKPSIIGCVRTS